MGAGPFGIYLIFNEYLHVFAYNILRYTSCRYFFASTLDNVPLKLYNIFVETSRGGAVGSSLGS